MNDYLIKDIDSIIDNHKPEIIETYKGNVVVLSLEDYNNITTHPYNETTINAIAQGRKIVSKNEGKTFNDFNKFLNNLKSDSDDNDEDNI